MVEIMGKYQQERSENLDGYFKAMGVPYIPRKIICSTSPAMEIEFVKTGEVIITTTTLFKTRVVRFMLGEEYEEAMPGGLLKCTTTRVGDKFVTVSVGPEDNKIERVYEFNDTHCVLTFKHEKSGQEAKRWFKRL